MTNEIFKKKIKEKNFKLDFIVYKVIIVLWIYLMINQNIKSIFCEWINICKSIFFQLFLVFSVILISLDFDYVILFILHTNILHKLYIYILQLQK